jgi:DNA-binding transcriptional LysR family regulator
MSESPSQRQRLRGVQLRHFALLAELGRGEALPGAAAALGCRKDELERLLGELEDALRTPLVESSDRLGAVELTAAGRVLARHAGLIMRRVEAARDDLDALHSTVRLRVGLDVSLATHVLPRILQILDAGTLLGIVLEESDDDGRLLTGVLSGELDLAFAELPLPPGPLAYEEVLDDPYVLLVPAASGLAERPQPPSREELARLALVGVRNRRLDPLPGLVEQTDSAAAARALVVAGERMAVLPGLCADPTDPETIAIDLATTLGRRRLALTWHSERPGGEESRAFRAATAVACRRLSAERMRLPSRYTGAPSEKAP